MAVDLDPPPTSVVASVRRKADGVEAEADWGDVSPEELVDVAAPWRTFSWYHGQKHYSGAYWASTERALVVYESRLELARTAREVTSPQVAASQNATDRGDPTGAPV